MKETELIWIATRIIGLGSFAALFLLVFIGELRMLKPGISVFKFHKPIGIFTVFLVILHFISAVVDNFKWGKSLSFVEYLGFSFNDKWLLFLSMGTLAAYLIILVAITSATKAIQTIGFKKWKIIHYVSYISFIMVFLHSLILGTDIKENYIIKVIFLVCAILVISTLIVRCIKAYVPIDGVEIILLITFFSLLLILTTVCVIEYQTYELKIQTEKDALTILQQQITEQEAEVLQVQTEINTLTIGDTT
jgi:predicted ferric reductase